jgi:hypothetical protein
LQVVALASALSGTHRCSCHRQPLQRMHMPAHVSTGRKPEGPTCSDFVVALAASHSVPGGKCSTPQHNTEQDKTRCIGKNAVTGSPWLAAPTYQKLRWVCR